MSSSQLHRAMPLLPARRSIAMAALVLAAPAMALATDVQDIADFSLEELANIKVTSVSKRPESLSDAASSIFVITGNDIRRSGATSLPEALGLAPNLQVARVDARNYAVTARGFNNPFENKLLVLIDGRTVYSPLFSGVFWDAQDVVLEDVERIEVISGPGATLWGANAVNGVINIITKSAADTRGTLVSVGASKDEKTGAVRYGGTLANGGHYRVYGKYAANDDTQSAAGAAILTGWHRQQAGFRTDWGDTSQSFVLQGDGYDGRLHQQGTRDIRIGGANLLGRLNRTLGGGSSLTLQAYWDHTERDQPLAFKERLDTLDLQLQHAVRFAGAHSVVWGGGYRLAHDRVENGAAFGFLPGTLNLHWANLFAQDEIALRDNLRLTAGLKLEENNYTGLELLPTLRLAWKTQANALAWSSVSRSVRSPSRIDRDFYSPTVPRIVNGVPQFAIAGGPDFASEVANVFELGYRAQPTPALSYSATAFYSPTVPRIVNGVPQFAIAGGPDFASEVANVFELGYRAQPTPALSYSATAFYSRYDKLRTLEPNRNGPGSVFENLAEGRTRGIETWASWQASAYWRLSAGGVVQRVDTQPNPASKDLSAATGLATSDPSHYWLLRSSLDVGAGKELDVTVRQVGALSRPAVPAYTAVDLRFGWRINPGLELSLVGQNLFDPQHAEFGAAPGRSEYRRAVFAKLVWTR
jgi:iron complex outermembrane receptor protein